MYRHFGKDAADVLRAFVDEKGDNADKRRQCGGDFCALMMSIARGLWGKKPVPMRLQPAWAAYSASSGVVMPQILVRIFLIRYSFIWETVRLCRFRRHSRSVDFDVFDRKDFNFLTAFRRVQNHFVAFARFN